MCQVTRPSTTQLAGSSETDTDLYRYTEQPTVSHPLTPLQPQGYYSPDTWDVYCLPPTHPLTHALLHSLTPPTAGLLLP
jgi:hypothetical protein